jgi:hypothetical protein
LLTGDMPEQINGNDVDRIAAVMQADLLGKGQAGRSQLNKLRLAIDGDG